MQKNINKALRLKQKRFIEEFIKTNNATEAAMVAYGCNNRVTAAAVGYENLRKPQIREEIERHLQGEGIDISLVLQSLKKNLTEGAGKNARASDSNQATEILLRASGAFEKDHSQVQYNLYADMRNIPMEDLLKKRQDLHDFFNQILEGEEVK